MKRFLLLTITLIFVGCNKSSQPSIDSLSGTTWECIVEETAFKTERVLIFSENNYTYSIKDQYDRNGDGLFEIDPIQSGSGSYTYTSPSVSLSEGDKVSLGTVSGNTLTLAEFIYQKK